MSIGLALFGLFVFAPVTAIVIAVSYTYLDDRRTQKRKEIRALAPTAPVQSNNNIHKKSCCRDFLCLPANKKEGRSDGSDLPSF